jgi:erythronate-4-phosphate dehydrogenase
MLDRKTLDRLSARQFLINSSRGAVFDNSELKVALQNSRIEGAVLDVWEKEPRIDYSLLDLVDIGTPHIAGSSLDGKIRATEMACEELCRYFKVQSSWDVNSAYPESGIIYPEKIAAGQDAVLAVLTQAFNIMKDDADLRKLRSSSRELAAAGFDRLRSEYRFRPEFRHFVVCLTQQHVQLADTFAALGFNVQKNATDSTDYTDFKIILNP